MKKSFILFIMLAGAMLLQAQVRPSSAQRPQLQQRPTTQPVGRPFILSNGKLGPIQTGARFANIPAIYVGLYDKYTYQKIEHESDMEDDWTEEFYQFTKGGINIFRVEIYGGTIASITLQEGSSSIVKTQDGYYVGYPARTLFTKKRMEWTTYFEATSFATSGHYTYHIYIDDLIGNECPTNVNQIKPNAKVCMITYSHNVETY